MLTDTHPGAVSPVALRGQWMRLFLHGLAEAGLQHIVVSPGSRNTPLIAAMLEDERFVCHSVLDERAAGFFALGLGRALGTTVGLCCTSGSAGAHYLPALIEADASALGLLVVTADRPAELQDCGAEQTIAQRGMFGRFARPGPPLPEPSTEPGKLRAILQQAYRAVRATRHPHPAPVHLNFPIGKPLELGLCRSAGELRLQALVDGLLTHGPTRLVSPELAPELVRTWWQDACSAGELVVTLGACTFDEAVLARRVCAERKLPLLAEFAQAGSAEPLDALARRFAELPHEAPQNILHIGAPSVSAAWNSWLCTASTRLWWMPGSRLRDPASQSHSILLAPLEAALSAMLDVAPTPLAANVASGVLPAPSPKIASGGASEPVHPPSEACLEETARLARAFQRLPASSDLRTTWAVLKRLDDRTTVLLGNSLPVRNAALAAPLLSGPRRFVFTRGVNGIDGHIAAAAGTAQATGRPTVALIGDVTAAHDLTSLGLARQAQTPLVLCVLDNAGGHIFDQLPAAEHYGHEPERWRFWTTPPTIEWRAAAQAYGVAFFEAVDEPSLEAGLAEALSRAGCTLLVCRTTSHSIALSDATACDAPAPSKHPTRVTTASSEHPMLVPDSRAERASVRGPQ